MFKVEFGVVHRGCLVNQLSRAVPSVRFICPGGFILGPTSAEEILVLDNPIQQELEAVLDHLERDSGIAECSLLERSGDKAFVRILTSASPGEGYCSEVVANNRGFRIGMEIQQGGLEKWKVGCFERANAEQLLKDLARLGEIKSQSISEVSWQELLGQGPA